MSNRGMPDSVKETWGLIQAWREENGGEKWPKPKQIHEMRPEISMSRLQDHFTYLRRHRFMPTDATNYQDAKRGRFKDDKRMAELRRIARELKGKGFG